MVMAATPKKGGSSSSPPVKLSIVDVEKVKGLSNYYAYIVKVTCSDGSTYRIYRRFKQFDEMHSALERRFPIEAGSINYKDRTLPTLPGKKLIGRSAIREVADKRLPLLNDYLKSLYLLPNKIRYDSIVARFSSLSPDDLSRPAYNPGQVRPNGISSSATGRPSRPPAPPSSHGTNLRSPSRPAPPTLRSPSRPVQLPQNSTHLPPRQTLPNRPPQPHPPANTGKGKALYSYSAAHSDELTFSEGDTLSLLELFDGGAWWKASLRGKTGIAPGNYIRVISKPVVRDFKDSVHDSDEWDSSDGELYEEEAESGQGIITYYYNDAARTVEVDATLITTPTYVQLCRAIQKQVHGVKVVLNYKDSDGDLVQLCGQQDMQLLASDATPPATPTGRRQLGKETRAPWAIYVSRQGDNSVYNINPT